MPEHKTFGAREVMSLHGEIMRARPGTQFPDAWQETKAVFMTMIVKSGSDRDPGQTWKTSSGRAFEFIAVGEVLKILCNDEFKSKGIVGKRWSELTKGQKDSLSQTMIRRCTGDKISLSSEPDITIFKGDNPRIILSCKSSLRDRVSIDLYWATEYARAGRKFIVVSAETSESIGTHNSPKKPRKIAECLYDRLYIVNGQTDYCTIVRPFSDLREDLAVWLR